ncbi:hypothetical protein [Methanospirillum sp.]
MPDFICPYCIEWINTRDIQFRCTNSADYCEREDDIEYANYWGAGVRPMGKIFKPRMSIFFGRINPVTCPNCGKPSTKMVCPLCHNELPLDAGEVEDYFITVIGTKASGKSVFLATIINALQQELGQKLNGSFRALNEETTGRYRRDFYDPLFKKNIKIDVTRSVRTIKKHPMIYRFNLSEGSVFEGTKKVINIVFYDTAGEDFERKEGFHSVKDTIQQDYRYILNSSGIIFILDPLQIQPIRDQLPPNIERPGSETDPNDIVDHVIDLIRKEKSIDVRDKINIPVAICFSKLDVLKPIINRNSVIFNRSPHGPFFDHDDFSQVHYEILSYLQKWMGSGFQNKIEHEFVNSGFFGFSALGSTPSKNGTLSNPIHSHRIEDPFCWLLWIYDLIEEMR